LLRTFILVAYVSPLILIAQTGAITGVVHDTSEAVIPKARITAKNLDTGAERAETAGDDGSYLLPALPPGRFTIEARAAGFTTLIKTGVKLDVAQTARIDFVLRPGALEQAVTVNAATSIIKTDSATVSTVIDRQFIENLPMNGRSFQSLIALTPGVVMTRASFGEQGQFSVNGQRANANYFTIDGVSANIGVSAGLTLVQSASGSLPGLGASGGTNTLVSVDALQEFRVQTSGYAPEYGRMPGAQITILTRSGTNQFHGALFDFFRNDALDANDWFANAESLPKPALRQNDFGGVVGGPLILPHLYHGRNRTFFFASYEGLRLRQPQVLSTDVPSIATRNQAGGPRRAFLDAFPIPNRPDSRFGFAKFVASYADVSSLNATSLRMDHLFGTRLSVFGRINHAPSTYTARLYALNNPTDTIADTDTLTIGSTLLISPQTTNEVRFNHSHTTGESYSRLDDFGGAKPLAPELFFPSFADPKNSFGGLFLLGGINSSWYLGKNVANAQRQFNLVDTFSHTAGKHQLKFGADWRRIAALNSPRAYDLFYSFVGTFGAVFGRTSQTTIGAQEEISVYFNNVSVFAQDTWKPTAKLTLTYGLRWEINPAPTGSLQLYTFQGYEQPKTIRPAPAGTPLYSTAWASLAPRLGVAWQLVREPGKETTLRGGFGLFHDLGAGIISQTAAGYPYFRQKNFLDGTPFPLPAEAAQPAPFSLNPPINSIYAAEKGLQLPVTYQWNVTLERSLGTSNALSIAYVAAAGRRLLRQEYFVNPNDDITYAYLLRNRASSDFNSLQVQFQRRLSRGLQVLLSYTWGKSLDTNSTDSASHLIALQIDPRRDRGPSDFDIRHTLSGAWSYSLPSIHGGGRLVTAFTRDWGLDGAVIARTASPVDVTFYRDLGFGLYNFRPDVVDGEPLYVADQSVAGGRRFNDSAFEIQGGFPSRQGTLGRNVLRGFGLAQLNLTIRREFAIVEPVRLQFRAEMFNAFNHPAFADPTGSLFSPQFGYSTRMLGRSLGRGGVNGGLNPLYQIGGPRSIQLALRLTF
jgi:hypothetical protein